MNWIETSNCATRQFCDQCLHDKEFRESIFKTYKWNGKCPHNRKYKGHIPIGSIIHWLLKRFQYPGCKCQARARIMNKWGLVRSIRNWKIIYLWFKEAYHERKHSTSG